MMTRKTTMRALVVDESAPGRIAVHEVPTVLPSGDQAIVNVRAFSLNRGEFRALKTAPAGSRPGWDFAGVLETELEGLPRGTRVAGLVESGAWAEWVAVPHDWIAAIPDTMTFEQAAAVPVAGLTALRTLRQGVGTLGRRLLITGASGGVGRFAVQLARIGGADVTALVGSTGGDANYGAGVQIQTHASQIEGPFDLIVDSIGGEVLSALIPLARPEGTVVSFGNTSEQTTAINVRDLYFDAAVTVQGFELFHRPRPFGPDLAFLMQLAASGRLEIPLSRDLPWTDMPEALELLGGRQAQGKVVLRIE